MSGSEQQGNSHQHNETKNGSRDLDNRLMGLSPGGTGAHDWAMTSAEHGLQTRLYSCGYGNQGIRDPESMRRFRKELRVEDLERDQHFLEKMSRFKHKFGTQ